jgi:hypothetical protein
VTDREEYRMGFKLTAAWVIGLIGSTVIVVLLLAGFSVCRKLALLVGVWSEPSLGDALAGWLVTCLVWLLLWLALRAWLIYRWVVR